MALQGALFIYGTSLIGSPSEPNVLTTKIDEVMKGINSLDANIATDVVKPPPNNCTAET